MFTSPPLNNRKWNHLNNIAYLINFSRLHTMPDTQNCSQCACCEETQSVLSCCVADFPLILLHLICVLLHSHCNWMTQTRLVSLCSLLTASKKPSKHGACKTRLLHCLNTDNFAYFPTVKPTSLWYWFQPSNGLPSLSPPILLFLPGEVRHRVSLWLQIAIVCPRKLGT